jgi:hypothetical protein
MGRWQGNLKNPAPNAVQESIDKSEKLIPDNSDFNQTDVGNRAKEIRRDTDEQKNFTISLYDIDETILTHLEQLQLQIEDQGKQVKVPIFYGSPERWVSAQRDGYMRDKQGKIILPAMILKRSNSAYDDSLKFFNRYLDTPAMKLFSEKNSYTQFSVLSNRNMPVNEVYNVLLPKHMILTYHFIIWTAYVEQMNKLIETIAYNTQDYWGSKKGFRFRTKVESGYSHTVEIQANDERVVKSEFDLITHGYVLPDQATYLERHRMTTQKMFTPKRFVVGAEVVSSDYDWSKKSSNREKWRNPNYPNLQADVPISTPITTVDATNGSTVNDQIEASAQIIGTLKSITASPLINPIDVGIDPHRPALRVVPPPKSMAAGGEEGYVSYDNEYFYIFAGGGWKSVAISEFTTSPPCQEGAVSFNNQYMYLYSSGSWKQVAINKFQ